MFRAGVLAGVISCSWLTAIFAEEIAPDDARAAIRQSAVAYAEAFAKKDSKAIAALFTPEAELVTADGTIFHGREAIAAEFAAGFANRPKGSVSIEILSIRPVAAGILVEDGASTFTAEGSEARTATRYTATHVKQPDGRWLIASVRELEAAPATPHDRLQALAWLIGDWQEDKAGSTIRTSWNWDESGFYLMGNFQLLASAGSAATGSHRIGWDGERKQLRSWIFDSNGGFANGWWQMNEDGTWTLHLTRIDATGQRTASRLTYSSDGKDAMVVSLDQMIQDGAAVSGGMHRIVRRPPEPSAQRQ